MRQFQPDDHTPSNSSCEHTMDEILKQCKAMLDEATPLTLRDRFFNAQAYQRYILTVYKAGVICDISKRLDHLKCGQLEGTCVSVIEKLRKLDVEKMPVLVRNSLQLVV